MESGLAGTTALIHACRDLSTVNTVRVVTALAALPMSDSAKGRLRSFVEQDLLGQSDRDLRSTPTTSVREAIRLGAPRARRIVTVRSVDPALVMAATSQLSSDAALVSACWVDRRDVGWSRALSRVEPDTAGRIVTNLVHQVMNSGSATAHAPRLVEVVDALPSGFRLSVAQIVDDYLSDSRGLLPEPFALVIGRADLDDLLHGFADVLGSATFPESVIDLFEVVARSVEPPQIVRRLDDQSDDETLADTADRDGSYWQDEELIADYGDDEGSLADYGGERGRGVSYDRGYGIEDQHAYPRRGRHLRVDVFSTTEAGARRPVSRAFIRGERHPLEVWIGLDRDARPTTVTNPAPFDDSAVDRESGDHTTLEVIVNHRGQAIQTAELFLPNDSQISSLPCHFELLVGPHEQDVYATVLVRQGNRLLSQSQLIGSGATTPDDPLPGGPIELVPEVVARSVESNSPSTQFDVCIAKPTHHDPVLLRQDGSAVAVTPWRDGIRTTVEIVANKIYDTAIALANAEGDEQWNELVRVVARQGTRLHGWLGGHGYGLLNDAERIQLLDADPTEPLPIEFVYDRGGIRDDAVPCPDWATILAEGSCKGCADQPLDHSQFVCPLGFWGLTKIIERQTGRATEDPGSLTPFAGALFAASGEVQSGDADATLELMKDLGVETTKISDWNNWTGFVRKRRPALMVVLPHQGIDPESAVDFLEIGPSSRLYAGTLRPGYVKAEGGPAPMVLLLGCSTANGSVSYQNFVSEFISNGAPIVVGTLATVLGRDAAPIAQGFVRDLVLSVRASSGEPLRFGETIRAVRRRMVVKRNPAALSLIAFGDSDWRMIGES